jgi:hypothetical protein
LSRSCNYWSRWETGLAGREKWLARAIAFVSGAGAQAESQVVCMGDGLRKQRADVFVVERIDDLPAVTLADHQTKMTENAELLRDRGLRHPDVARELTD